MEILGKVKNKRLNEDVKHLLDALGVEEKADVAIEKKANEAMNETNANDGGNWVPVEMARNIITKARANSSILSRLPQENIITMNSATWTSPVEGTDPSFEAGSENTDVPGTATTTSKPSTPLMTITARRHSASIYMSGEVEEDGVQNGTMRRYVENKLGVAWSELIEKLIINGDRTTGATGNVNSDDGAPTAKSYYLHQDGLVKTAVSNSKTFDAGILAFDDITSTRALMGIYGLNTAQLAVIMNPETYYKSLTLAEFKTLDVFGNLATALTGQIERPQGMALTTNPYFLKAEADGKRSVTEGNNTLGRFIIAHLPSIYVGVRRALKITVSYLDDVDQFRVTGHVRSGLSIQNGADGSVAMARNITL